MRAGDAGRATTSTRRGELAAERPHRAAPRPRSGGPAVGGNRHRLAMPGAAAGRSSTRRLAALTAAWGSGRAEASAARSSTAPTHRRGAVCWGRSPDDLVGPRRLRSVRCQNDPQGVIGPHSSRSSPSKGNSSRGSSSKSDSSSSNPTSSNSGRCCSSRWCEPALWPHRPRTPSTRGHRPRSAARRTHAPRSHNRLQPAVQAARSRWPSSRRRQRRSVGGCVQTS